MKGQREYWFGYLLGVVVTITIVWLHGGILDAQNTTNCAQVPGSDVCSQTLLGIGHGTVTSVAATASRFGLSDDVIITGGRTVWLLHDRAHADKCLLVVETKAGVTAQAWSCQ